MHLSYREDSDISAVPSTILFEPCVSNGSGEPRHIAEPGAAMVFSVEA